MSGRGLQLQDIDAIVRTATEEAWRQGYDQGRREGVELGTKHGRDAAAHEAKVWAQVELEPQVRIIGDKLADALTEPRTTIQAERDRLASIAERHDEWVVGRLRRFIGRGGRS